MDMRRATIQQCVMLRCQSHFPRPASLILVHSHGTAQLIALVALNELIDALFSVIEMHLLTRPNTSRVFVFNTHFCV
jgi:hypothetical protein